MISFIQIFSTWTFSLRKFPCFKLILVSGLSDECDVVVCEVCCMLDDNDEAYCTDDALGCPIDPHIDFENLRTTVIIVLGFIIGRMNSLANDWKQVCRFC